MPESLPDSRFPGKAPPAGWREVIEKARGGLGEGCSGFGLEITVEIGEALLAHLSDGLAQLEDDEAVELQLLRCVARDYSLAMEAAFKQVDLLRELAGAVRSLPGEMLDRGAERPIRDILTEVFRLAADVGCGL